MTDQKNIFPSQKDPSPLTPEQRRRMRETAEAAARVRGLDILGSEGGASYERHIAAANPSAVLELIDALEQTEQERDALREHVVVSRGHAIQHPESWDALRDALESTDGPTAALRKLFADEDAAQE